MQPARSYDGLDKILRNLFRRRVIERAFLFRFCNEERGDLSEVGQGLMSR